MKTKMTSDQLLKVGDKLVTNLNMTWFLIIMEVIGLIISGIFIVHQRTTPLDVNEVESLKVAQKLIEEDILNISKVEGATVSVESSNIVVNAFAKDCKLEVVMDKEYNVVSNKIINTRVGNSLIDVICIIFAALVISFFSGLILLIIIAGILDLIIWLKRKKEQKETLRANTIKD